MTESELVHAAKLLAKREAKLSNTVQLFIESSDALQEHLQKNREYFSKHLHAFDSTEELMRVQISALKDIIAGMESIAKASFENNVAINENTERMKALLSKVESYFGSGEGLEYDN